MDHDERYEVRNPDIERALRTLAALIDVEVPEGWGWGLFMVQHGNHPKEEGGAVFWISNSERAGMIDAVKGWIEDNERRTADRVRDGSHRTHGVVRTDSDD